MAKLTQRSARHLDTGPTGAGYSRQFHAATSIHQRVAACHWTIASGRVPQPPGARLTEVLRRWIQHDSGYPSNWMPETIQRLPKQLIMVVPAGFRRGGDEAAIWQQSANPAGCVRPAAADCLRECR